VAAGGAAALIAAVIAATIAHGALRPLLEARGVAPWTVRDTLGSTPLVVLGAALSAGSVTASATLVAMASVPVWSHVLCLALLAAGALALRLGLLALRKLT